jgi:hypothetical protein
MSLITATEAITKFSLIRKLRGQPRWLDLIFFVVFAIDAGQTALRSEFYGFRILG